MARFWGPRSLHLTRRSIDYTIEMNFQDVIYVVTAMDFERLQRTNLQVIHDNQTSWDEL